MGSQRSESCGVVRDAGGTVRAHRLEARAERKAAHRVADLLRGGRAEEGGARGARDAGGLRQRLCQRAFGGAAGREKGGPDRDELCAALLKALLGQALTRTQSDPAAPPERLIESVGRYLDAHCREKITLEQLGRAFGYHPFYLNRLFRERTGTTLHRRQMECRMNRACSMLASTGLSVREIAYSLGLSSPAYFSELFKAMQGMTPGPYRRDWRREKS